MLYEDEQKKIFSFVGLLEGFLKESRSINDIVIFVKLFTFL